MTVSDQGLPSVGFIGVGAIGRPMAERMLRHFPLTICDSDVAARSHFVGKAPLVSSARELAEVADIVFACLPSLESYRAVVLAPGGLSAGGRMQFFIHVGTTGTELVRDIDAALVDRGVGMLDAPVSGGAPRARLGDLMVMASGRRDIFELVEPMIRCYASSVIYLGAAPGLAQTMKLINNVLSAANLAVAAEVLTFGAKVGLDPAQMLEVLNGGTGQNSATLTKIPHHILPRTFDYGGRLQIVVKDLAMCVSEADRMGLHLPFSELIAATYRAAIAQEGPNADMTTVIRQMERAAGVEVVAATP
jgi:3-hydroxyisobutyrate dehydrogenase-like beta-hydroxyacid dehydrogenase